MKEIKINGYRIVEINPPSNEDWEKIIKKINNMFEEKYGKPKNKKRSDLNEKIKIESMA